MFVPTDKSSGARRNSSGNGCAKVIDKTGNQPLTGAFRREHDELMVLVSNTVLNLARLNHMREALLSRRIGLGGK